MKRPLPLLLALICSARLVAFDVQTTVQHATCGDTTGTIYAWPSGGVWPYTYLWSDGSTGNPLTGAPAGTYSVTITDSEGETGYAEVEIIQTAALFPPMSPGVDIWTCSADCEGGFAQYQLVMNGVQPYTVVADPPGPSGSAYPNYLGVYAMCVNTPYTITVTDAEGCTGVYGPVTVVEAPGPNILSWSADPSCPDGATGSLTVQYDQIDSMFVSGPDQYFAQPTTNPFSLTNLAPGTYYINGTILQDNLPPYLLGSGCYVTDSIVVPVTSEPCGTLNGILFADVDADCTQGVGDPGLPFRVLSVQPGDHLAMTAGDGSYSTQFFYGSYELNGSIDGYSSDCTPLPAAFTLNDLNPTSTINLPMTPTFGPDLSVGVYMGGAVPGFDHAEYLVVTNAGPYSFTNVAVDLYYDAVLNYVSANPAPDIIEAGHLQWNLANADPFTTSSFTPLFHVPANTGLIGTSITSNASLVVTDSDETNNTDQTSRTIQGSFDPNVKLAETSSRLSSSAYYLAQDYYVDYTIHFQNTGTGPAYNVSLLDTVSSLLDLTTFSILAASHDYEASLDDPRVLRFNFQNINLPDSGSDFLGSQGFISFRLRPVGSLAVGQQLVNAADIFFDLNAPIRTNDAVLNVEQTTGVEDHEAAALLVYPNPVSDVLSVDLPGAAVRMDVIAADGRVVISQRAMSGTNRTDLSVLTPGAYSLRITDKDGSFQHARFVKR